MYFVGRPSRVGVKTLEDDGASSAAAIMSHAYCQFILRRDHNAMLAYSGSLTLLARRHFHMIFHSPRIIPNPDDHRVTQYAYNSTELFNVAIRFNLHELIPSTWTNSQTLSIIRKSRSSLRRKLNESSLCLYTAIPLCHVIIPHCAGACGHKAPERNQGTMESLKIPAPSFSQLAKQLGKVSNELPRERREKDRVATKIERERQREREWDLEVKKLSVERNGSWRPEASFL